MQPHRIVHPFFLDLILALVGCGGGGTSVLGEHPPTIMNLQFSPTSALQAAGGVVTLRGTVDFSDAGGDVTVLHLTSSAGANVTTPLSIPGVTSAKLVGDFVVSVDQVGHFMFDVWLEDSMGRTSNHLGSTFDVMAR